MTPDIYVWKARRCPVLLAVLPAALAALATYPDLNPKLLLPACTFCGLFMLVGQLGRDRGSQLQETLFESWGGSPTTAMLRRRSSPFDSATLAMLHAWLEGMTGAPAPSRRKESASPDDADCIYDSYVRHLRDATRDKKKFPLVFEENVSYGFRRNTLGLKPFGIALATVGTAGAAINFARFRDGPHVGVAVASTAVSVTLLLFWIFWVRPGWVRIPAQAYAERLMEAALRMAKEEPKKRGRTEGGNPPKRKSRGRAGVKASPDIYPAQETES
jgi:hypothetical protein